jgi:hypothetical protein
MISTALWLDAADSSTITTVSSAVSQWNDKSGNAFNVTQSDSALRPALTANGLNSKSVLTFDGGDRLAGPISTLLRNVAGGTFYAVARLDNNASERWLIQILTGTAVTRLGVGFKFSGPGNNGLAAAARRLDADAFAAVGAGAYNSNTALYGVRLDYSTANIQLYENATQSLSTTIQTAGNTSDTSGSFTIGAQVSGTLPFLGIVAEMLVINSAASTDTRRKLEGYLAHKWGLEANLPSDHPYKTNAPAP